MSNNIGQEILAFILDPSSREHTFRSADWTQLIIKVAYNDSVDFLYSQYHYQCSNPLQIGEKLEYAGFVHHPTGRIFDGSYILFRHQENIDTLSLESVKKDTLAAIKDALIAYVNMEPVPVTMAADVARNNREYHENYYSVQESREAFFRGVKEITYKPSVSLELSTDQIIQMVMDKEAFVAAWVDDYTLRKANHINERLWEITVSQEKLDALWSTPGTHHTTLAIAKSIEEYMKTVNLHLDKDGIHMAVKYEAYRLRIPDTDDYADWHMDAPSRRAFEAAYGRHARLYPSDIERITYGKKVLYKRMEDAV